MKNLTMIKKDHWYALGQVYISELVVTKALLGFWKYWVIKGGINILAHPTNEGGR